MSTDSFQDTWTGGVWDETSGFSTHWATAADFMFIQALAQGLYLYIKKKGENDKKVNLARLIICK